MEKEDIILVEEYIGSHHMSVSRITRHGYSSPLDHWEARIGGSPIEGTASGDVFDAVHALETELLARLAEVRKMVKALHDVQVVSARVQPGHGIAFCNRETGKFLRSAKLPKGGGELTLSWTADSSKAERHRWTSAKNMKLTMSTARYLIVQRRLDIIPFRFP